MKFHLNGENNINYTMINNIDTYSELKFKKSNNYYSLDENSKDEFDYIFNSIMDKNYNNKSFFELDENEKADFINIHFKSKWNHHLYLKHVTENLNLSNEDKYNLMFILEDYVINYHDVVDKGLVESLNDVIKEYEIEDTHYATIIENLISHSLNYSDSMKVESVLEAFDVTRAKISKSYRKNTTGVNNKIKHAPKSVANKDYRKKHRDEKKERKKSIKSANYEYKKKSKDLKNKRKSGEISKSEYKKKKEKEKKSRNIKKDKAVSNFSNYKNNR